MKFPRFWARGRSGDFLVWRWSFESLLEAQALADRAAQQIAERFREGNYPPRHATYYPDRPFREQVLEEIKSETGEALALITRNSYGCLVLNTERGMFVDIDLPEPKRSGGFFKRLLGKADASPAGNPHSEAMARIENWTGKNPEWGWRVYRTRSGLRLLATHGLVDANSEIANRVFDAVGADPLYRKLCNTQKCFRARLTPKPWRCGISSKPARWPWLDAKQEKRFQNWQAQYQSRSTHWATCEFLRQLGNPTIHPAAQAILKVHDERTRAASKLQLA